MSYIDETLPICYYGMVVCPGNITLCGLKAYLILCLRIKSSFLPFRFNIIV